MFVEREIGHTLLRPQACQYVQSRLFRIYGVSMSWLTQIERAIPLHYCPPLIPCKLFCFWNLRCLSLANKLSLDYCKWHVRDNEVKVVVSQSDLKNNKAELVHNHPIRDRIKIPHAKKLTVPETVFSFSLVPLAAELVKIGREVRKKLGSVHLPFECYPATTPKYISLNYKYVKTFIRVW